MSHTVSVSSAFTGWKAAAQQQVKNTSLLHTFAWVVGFFFGLVWFSVLIFVWGFCWFCLFAVLGRGFSVGLGLVFLFGLVFFGGFCSGGFVVFCCCLLACRLGFFVIVFWFGFFLFPEAQLEMHPFQRRPLWALLASSVTLNLIKLFLEYWINPLAKKHSWKKEKKHFPYYSTLYSHQPKCSTCSIHSPSFSFFSWFSSAAVLSALKKILALLSEK